MPYSSSPITANTARNNCFACLAITSHVSTQSTCDNNAKSDNIIIECAPSDQRPRVHFHSDPSMFDSVEFNNLLSTILTCPWQRTHCSYVDSISSSRPIHSSRAGWESRAPEIRQQRPMHLNHVPIWAPIPCRLNIICPTIKCTVGLHIGRPYTITTTLPVVAYSHYYALRSPGRCKIAPEVCVCDTMLIPIKSTH